MDYIRNEVGEAEKSNWTNDQDKKTSPTFASPKGKGKTVQPDNSSREGIYDSGARKSRGKV